MAGNVVSLTFAGDSKSLEKSFDTVGKAAKDTAKDFDEAGGKATKFAGKMDDVGGSVGNAEGKFMGAADLLDGLGGAFGLPTEQATGLFRAFGDLSGGFEVVQGLFSSVVGKLGAMTGATAAQTAATTGATGAQTGLNAAMTANPIGAVVLAIVALVAIGVVLWKNWDTIKEKLSAVWDWMKTAFSAVKDWIGDRVSDMVSFFVGLPGRITAAVGQAFKIVMDQATAAKDWVFARIGDIVGFYADLPRRLAHAAAGLFDWFTDMFKAAFNGMVALWNSIEFHLPEIDLPGPLGKIGGQTIGLPDLPKFHQGGVVPGQRGTQVPILAMAGETVIPAGAGGGTTVIQLVLDGRVVTEVVYEGLLRRQRGGNLGLT